MFIDIWHIKFTKKPGVFVVSPKNVLHCDRLKEKGLSEENQFLTLKALEQEFSAPLQIEIKGISNTIYIKGKIDRIDSHEGKTRIIDYKSSIKTSDKFSFVVLGE